MDRRVSRFEGSADVCRRRRRRPRGARPRVARAVQGPTVFDRVLAANTVGTLAILLLAVLGFLTGRPELLDIGITYGLLNVISTLAVLKFFRHGDLGYDAEEEAQVVTLADRRSRAGRCILAGSFFIVVGAIGLVRMPDFYTRMHAASVTETLGPASCFSA